MKLLEIFQASKIPSEISMEVENDHPEFPMEIDQSKEKCKVCKNLTKLRHTIRLTELNFSLIVK